MNAQKFDAIVKARANQRVQDKLATFKQEIRVACAKLAGNAYSGTSYQLPAIYQDILKVMASYDINRGWPVSLWNQEESLVEKELLNIMDEMQKAILAAEKAGPGDNMPAEVAE